MALQRRPMIRREPVHPKRRDHIAIPRTPEHQRIDQRLAHDHIPARDQRRFIPDAAQGHRQIQILRLIRRNLVVRSNPPAVHLPNRARFPIQHRHHQAPVQVLMTRLPVHAHALQLLAHLPTVFRIPRRQPVRQALVRIAQLERLDHLTTHQLPLRQVPAAPATAQTTAYPAYGPVARASWLQT